MARMQTKVNKSEEIRQAMKANPSAGPTEIATKLGEKGIKVTPAMVSTVKNKAKTSKGNRGPKGKKRGRPAGSTIRTNGYSEVESTIVFVKGVGGLDKAKQLIALMEKARGM
ncbi:MAG TPA: hypothetical protein VG713_22600 [Pirellulales bacterium]|nr:hypothetical protein [Pirellulales bacterium]